jgi:hypothetical protein
MTAKRLKGEDTVKKANETEINDDNNYMGKSDDKRMRFRVITNFCEISLDLTTRIFNLTCTLKHANKQKIHTH